VPLTTTTVSSSGSDAIVSVTVSGNAITEITVTNPGSDYAIRDDLLIDKRYFDHTGALKTGLLRSSDSGPPTGALDSPLTDYQSITLSGGAVADVNINSNVVTVTITSTGSGYMPGDKLVVPAGELDLGLSTDPNVLMVDGSNGSALGAHNSCDDGLHTGLGISATSGSGSGATFDVAILGGIAVGIHVVTPGNHFADGDTITLDAISNCNTNLVITLDAGDISGLSGEMYIILDDIDDFVLGGSTSDAAITLKGSNFNGASSAATIKLGFGDSNTEISGSLGDFHETSSAINIQLDGSAAALAAGSEARFTLTEMDIGSGSALSAAGADLTSTPADAKFTLTANHIPSLSAPVHYVLKESDLVYSNIESRAGGTTRYQGYGIGAGYSAMESCRCAENHVRLTDVVKMRVEKDFLLNFISHSPSCTTAGTYSYEATELADHYPMAIDIKGSTVSEIVISDGVFKREVNALLTSLDPSGINSGADCKDGTYKRIPLQYATGSGGTGATVQIVCSSSAITGITVDKASAGTGYASGDSLKIPGQYIGSTDSTTEYVFALQSSDVHKTVSSITVKDPASDPNNNPYKVGDRITINGDTVGGGGSIQA
jgi:hypothetical protein